MKKILSVCLSLCLVLSLSLMLTACGNKYVGTWKFYSLKTQTNGMSVELTVGETYMGMITLTEEFMVIDVKEDGTFAMSTSAMGENTSVSGTWEVVDGDLNLTAEGETIVAKKDGKLLVLSEDDSGMSAEIAFKK